MLKNRENIEEKYKWNLDSLYPSDEAWHEDVKSLDELLPKFDDIKGKLLSSEESLITAVDLYLESSRKLGKIFTYSKMKQDENTKSSHYQEFFAKANALGVKFGEATAFITPEILSGDPEILAKFMKHESLVMYKQYMDDILRTRPHILSDAEEAILAQAGELFGAPSNTFGMLNGADLVFPEVNGESLTHGSFIPFMKRKEREVREEAFKKYYGVYEQHKNTFASLLSTEVKKNIFNAKVRKYSSAREAALSSNNVPESVYDGLIDAVHKNLPAMHKYIALRKRMLNVDELRPYDLYVSLIDDVDMKFTYEEGQKVVLDSLHVLGKDYTDVVESSYKDGWIDVYENVGKRSGAYSWGTYDSKPYILLNYHDELSDVFTLTHEMGHSLHSYYTRKNQPYVYGNYSIFVAEVASTTNEAFLNKYLLDRVEDKQEKLYLLNNYLENFRGTVFRQTMFAEYEREIHKFAAEGGALTAEQFCRIYRELNQKYYGPELVIDSELDLEWARIPHFYYNFYVFQYATGFSAAVALADKMVTEGEEAVNAYKSFLGAGSSDYPIEVLKKAGVDMTTPDPVNNALAVFTALVDEMEKLV